jgi:hypothetical protein
MVSMPFEVQKEQLFMMSPSKEVFAKIEGNAEVSQAINTFTPGVN